MKTRTIKCNFKNSRGHTLDARLDVPADFSDSTDDPTETSNKTVFIIFCHCFTCSKETITTFRISRQLAEQGYGVLRFDFTGLGKSEGEFSDTTFASTQDDVRSAIDFLKQNYREPEFVMGHSLGGTSVLSIAQEYSHIKGVVTVASPSEPEHVLHHFGHALTLLEHGSAASFEVAGQFFDIKPEFVESVRNTDMQAYLSELDKPVLVFNIENDTVVVESNAKEIQAWVKGAVTYIDVSNSDHLLSNREVVTEVVGDIVGWMDSVS